jgi:hypothetical protein
MIVEAGGNSAWQPGAITKPTTEGLQENYRNAWQDLRMIRQAVETVGPLGALLSQYGSVLTAGRGEIRDGLNFAERSTAIARRATERVIVEHVNVHAGRPFTSA